VLERRPDAALLQVPVLPESTCCQKSRSTDLRTTTIACKVCVEQTAFNSTIKFKRGKNAATYFASHRRAAHINATSATA